MKKSDLVKLYQSHKLYLFPVTVALSSIFLIAFIIYPQTIKLIENQKASGDLISKSKLLETKVAALERFNEEDLSQKTQVALVSLPLEKDLGEIIGLLQQIGAQSGFSVASISVSVNNAGSPSGGNTDNTAKTADLNDYKILLSVQGPKVLLQSLLKNLESSPRLIKINNIDIASNSKSSEIIEVSLSLSVLYAPLPENLVKADSPLPDLTQNDEELISNLEMAEATVSSSNQLSPKGKANPFE